MNASTRFVLGGIGGLAPIVLFLVNLDFELYVANATTWTTVGYAVRAVLLFALGGFVAYLHEKEKKRITLFLVGVAAPSLIAGYLSTSSPGLSQAGFQATPLKGACLDFFLPNAHAQPPAPATSEIKQFTLPPQNPASQFVQGLIGVRPKNVWFVIVGSHLDLADAKRQTADIAQEFQSYHPEVYAPYKDNPYYAVVIGAHLTQAEAKALRDRAVKDDLPGDSYYKTFPGLPQAP